MSHIVIRVKWPIPRVLLCNDIICFVFLPTALISSINFLPQPSAFDIYTWDLLSFRTSQVADSLVTWESTADSCTWPTVLFGKKYRRWIWMSIKVKSWLTWKENMTQSALNEGDAEDSRIILPSYLCRPRNPRPALAARCQEAKKRQSKVEGHFTHST